MSAPLLCARDVRKSVATKAGTLSILGGVDLDLQRGEAVAVLGASGSGKSTLLSLLAGLDLPTGGSIRIDDVEITGTDEDARARLRARYSSFVFQAFHLFDDLTAEENIALPLELFGHKGAIAAAREWLHHLGLQDRRNHFPRQLSGGEQQRVALGRAFAQRPELLFADEPTANLDRETARSVVEQLFRLRTETNTAMLLVTHDEDVAGKCDRVLQLEQGRLSEPLAH
ncbi:MAG: ABC transporter ATP-binding protein [Pseudomonadota bacterium]